MIKRRTHLLVGSTIALAVIACQVDGARAQASVFEPTYEHQYSRLDVNFSGGNLMDYIDTIRRARPKGAANIVVMPRAKTMEVPPMSLVAVTVEAAVRLLEGAYILPDGRSAEIRVEAYPLGNTPDIVFKVMAAYETREIRSSVWSLDSVLYDGHSEKELLGAIDVVLSLFPNKADIKFHPPTRLLIARGTDEQLHLVREVIEQLIGSAEYKRARIDDLKNTIEDLMEQQHEYSARLMDIDAEMTERKHYITRKIKEEGSDKSDAQDWMIEARLEDKRGQVQYNMVNDRLNRVNQRLKKVQDVLTDLAGPSL